MSSLRSSTTGYLLPIPPGFKLPGSLPLAATDSAPGFFQSGAAGVLLEGGLFMWPILILLILAIAVINVTLGGAEE